MTGLVEYSRYPGESTRSPWLLRATLFSILAFPPYMVLAPLGASGGIAQVLALLLFGLWAVSTLLALHNPVDFRHPGRASILLLLLASCASYFSLFAGLSGASTVLGRSAADRWMLLIFASAAIAFATTECIRTPKDAMVLTRWVLAGGTFCCVMALIQFITRTDPLDSMTPYMLGFVENGDASGQARGAFIRVAGTTMHPIELGVVSAMLLPLAVWRAAYDEKGRKTFHWAVVGLLALANAMTVSRSALIGLVIAVGLTVPFLPRTIRRWSVLVMPLGAAMIFVTVPGLLTTMMEITTAASADSSITYRTNDYPLALRLIAERPWFGIGPGTWIPTRPIDNFDNTYLLVAVTLGVVGLIGLLAYLLVPVLASLIAVWYAKGNELKLLTASTASAGLTATITSGTFDSMSFPAFALLLPFFVGLSGACWLMVKSQLDPDRLAPAGTDIGTLPWR
jgi:O-antigen ligase